jgi:hypothetical protein
VTIVFLPQQRGILKANRAENPFRMIRMTDDDSDLEMIRISASKRYRSINLILNSLLEQGIKLMSVSYGDLGMGKEVIVGNIRVDVPALMSIRHSCRPGVCKGAPNCCSCFQIHVNEKELETIVGFLPLVEKYTPSIGGLQGYDNIFEEAEDDCFLIDADENERCVFAYTTAREEILCSLHSAALDLGLPPVDVKPKCCSLWPLALTKGPDRVLSINALYAAFPCNQKKAVPEGIDAGIQETIRIYFGASFLSELLSKAGG